MTRRLRKKTRSRTGAEKLLAIFETSPVQPSAHLLRMTVAGIHAKHKFRRALSRADRLWTKRRTTVK